MKNKILLLSLWHQNKEMDLRKPKTSAFIKHFMAILFIAYACSVSFFYHVHIVDGVTIVHSHPYSSDADGNPGHEHTTSQLQLISVLSSFVVFSSIFIAIFIGLTAPYFKRFYFETKNFSYQNLHLYLSRLRPPPAV